MEKETEYGVPWLLKRVSLGTWVKYYFFKLGVGPLCFPGGPNPNVPAFLILHKAASSATTLRGIFSSFAILLITPTMSGCRVKVIFSHPVSRALGEYKIL